MTPVMFVSFLISLVLVDLRYSALRAHYHPDDPQHRSRLPGWLHRIVYRYRPYRYQDVIVDEKGRPVEGAIQRPPTSPSSPGSPGSPGSGREAEDYYHSKQRKLMKMEAEEAFEIRGAVVVVLGLVSLAMLWAVCKAVAWVIRMIFYGL